MKSLYWTLKICILVIIAVIWINVQKMYECYGDLQKSINGYMLAKQDIANFTEASDYLTEQARLYVVTGNLENMQNYFTEINVTKRREKALNGLLTGGGEERFLEYQFLKKSFEFSAVLTDPEIHAMRLMARANRMKEEDLDLRLRNYKLMQSEMSYSREEARQAAEKLIFGTEYMNLKREITRKVTSSTNAIVENTLENQENYENQIGILFGVVKKLVVVCIILELLSVLVILERKKDSKQET